MITKWTTTKDDVMIIAKIVKRLATIAKQQGCKIDHMSAVMDMEAAHMDCPIQLQDLLEAKDFNFAHDVCGIT